MGSWRIERTLDCAASNAARATQRAAPTNTQWIVWQMSSISARHVASVTSWTVA